MRKHLNDMVVRELSNGPTYSVWDRSLPSFGLRIGRTTKTFVLKQKNTYFNLGRYPVISLKEARDEAKRRLALKYFPQRSLNATEAIPLYLEAQNLRPLSLKQYQRALDAYFVARRGKVTP